MRPMTDLLEREELLAALAAALDEGGRLVFVGGEAGAGKSTLARAFCAGVDVPVLQGSCENLATPIPLGPFTDIASTAGGTFPSTGATSIRRASMSESPAGTLGGARPPDDPIEQGRAQADSERAGELDQSVDARHPPTAICMPGWSAFTGTR